MNQNRRDNDQRQQRRERIQILAQQVQALSEQLNELIIQENLEQHPPLDNQHQFREPGEFREGDRVRIRNNHRGLRGAIGIVIRVTQHQVSLRLIGQNRIVNRKRSNVELVGHDGDN